MKSITKLVLAIVILTAVSSCKVKQSGTDKDGFTTIFNGKNWDGWYLKLRKSDSTLAKEVFTIENGIVHVFKTVPVGSELKNGTNPSHGLFYTNKSYSKFIFKFEYKWGKNTANNFDAFQYDAGMYYHVTDDKIWPIGIEYQVRYNHTKNENHTGDFVGPVSYDWTSDANGKFAFAADGGKSQTVKGGQHYAKPTQNYNGLNDKWNQCEVIVMDGKYAIQKLNGEVVNVATNFSVSQGKIGLQSETGEIYYRNIKIKEFKEFVPMEEFLNKK